MYVCICRNVPLFDPIISRFFVSKFSPETNSSLLLALFTELHLKANA